MVYQRTLDSDIYCTGVGLHSGKEISLTLKPAPPDTGIVFVRTDLHGDFSIKAKMEAVIASSFATTLGKNGVSIATIEHLLAAFSGLGIDNAIVEVDAAEIPIMDGSATPFVSLIRNAGVVEQERPRQYMVIRKTIRIADGERWIELRPHKTLQISCTVDFDHPVIAKQFYQIPFSGSIFQEEISPARTFGFLREVEQLRTNGYALGGSLENAIVVDDFRILNKGGLRFPDEFVRHKILDLIGDLYLLGHPVLGHLVAYKSGHSLNHRLVREILSRKETWVMMAFSKNEIAKTSQFVIPAFGSLESVPA